MDAEWELARNLLPCSLTQGEDIAGPVLHGTGVVGELGGQSLPGGEAVQRAGGVLRAGRGAAGAAEAKTGMFRRREQRQGWKLRLDGGPSSTV